MRISTRIGIILAICLGVMDVDEGAHVVYNFPRHLRWAPLFWGLEENLLKL